MAGGHLQRARRNPYRSHAWGKVALIWLTTVAKCFSQKERLTHELIKSNGTARTGNREMEFLNRDRLGLPSWRLIRSRVSRRAELRSLQRAVERLHQCSAYLIETVPIRESFKSHWVCEGVVHVFGLRKHAYASRCYAWSSFVAATGERRFYAVLGTSVVTSASDALRTALGCEKGFGYEA